RAFHPIAAGRVHSDLVELTLRGSDGGHAPVSMKRFLTVTFEPVRFVHVDANEVGDLFPVRVVFDIAVRWPVIADQFSDDGAPITVCMIDQYLVDRAVVLAHVHVFSPLLVLVSSWWMIIPMAPHRHRMVRLFPVSGHHRGRLRERVLPKRG